MTGTGNNGVVVCTVCGVKQLTINKLFIPLLVLQLLVFKLNKKKKKKPTLTINMYFVNIFYPLHRMIPSDLDC